MKTLFAACILLLSANSFATQNATLNANEITVNNAIGEDIIVQRTSMTPEKVKLYMNSHIEHHQVCVREDVRNYCGYDSYRCGVIYRRVCNHHGCYDEAYPQYCCYSEEYCSAYGDQTSQEYEKIDLKFKKVLPLSPGQMDSIRIIPTGDLKKVDVEVISSLHPYSIKKSGGHSFEFQQH